MCISRSYRRSGGWQSFVDEWIDSARYVVSEGFRAYVCAWRFGGTVRCQRSALTGASTLGSRDEVFARRGFTVARMDWTGCTGRRKPNRGGEGGAGGSVPGFYR